MFEVGKLTDESLDSFITELGKVTKGIPIQVLNKVPPKNNCGKIHHHKKHVIYNIIVFMGNMATNLLPYLSHKQHFLVI